MGSQRCCFNPVREVIVARLIDYICVTVGTVLTGEDTTRSMQHFRLDENEIENCLLNSHTFDTLGGARLMTAPFNNISSSYQTVLRQKIEPTGASLILGRT